MTSNKQHAERLQAYTIQSEDGSSAVTVVPERGGVLSSIVMPGNSGPRELLFQHDYFWDEIIDDLPGGAPWAFPVFARLERQGQRGAYLYDGKLYYLPIHGFAWQEPWEIELTAANRMTLRLRDNERTFAQYPFRFLVTLEYEIRCGQLICSQTYANLGHRPMPYCAGFHPYFLTPLLTKSQVQLNFHPVRRFLYNEALTDLVGEGELFILPSAITDPKLNEQLTQIAEDKEIILSFPDGDTLHLCAEGVEDDDLFRYVQLYNIPEKPFFCIEPIMGVPNALNSVSGMRWLVPGQAERGLLTLRLER